MNIELSQRVIEQVRVTADSSLFEQFAQIFGYRTVEIAEARQHAGSHGPIANGMMKPRWMSTELLQTTMVVNCMIAENKSQTLCSVRGRRTR